MGAWYVPEIFVPSEKRILSRRWDFPCCRTNVQNSVRNLRHVPVWRRIRFMRSFV